MAKQPKLFFKSRLKGIWRILTNKYFVVLAADDYGSIGCSYNVTHASFQLMARVIDPAYEEEEGKKAALRAARELLS